MRFIHSVLIVALGAAHLTPTAPDAYAEEFTPLDEIERVRKAGCGLDNFENFFASYVSSTESGGWLEQVVFTDFTVKIGNLTDPDGPGDWVNRQDYAGQFRITSPDYSMSQRGLAGVDNRYRLVALHRLSNQKYRVDWRGGPGWAGVKKTISSERLARIYSSTRRIAGI